VAGGLFAQSFSGSVETGAKIVIDDGASIAANDNDGHAVKYNLGFGNSGEDWGVNISANANVGNDGGTNGVNVGDMNGWVKFADIFTLSAGKGRGGNWQATGDVFDDGPGGSNAGARLNIAPIPGLDFGFVFGYPNHGVKAAKIENFFQELGFGAKYDAGIFVAGTAVELFSEESDGYSGLSANWWIDAKIPLSFFTIHLDAYIKDLTEKGPGKEIAVGEKFNGSVAGLDWYVKAKEFLVPDPLKVELSAGVGYGIPISDKASVDLGADVGATYKDELGDIWWDVSATLNYTFNGNVSTWVEFDLDGTVDPSKVTPSLQWYIKYSF